MSSADDPVPSFGFQIVRPPAEGTNPTTAGRADRFGHRQRFVLPAPPSRVWQALTDEEELGSWWGEGSTLDARLDGDGRFTEPGRPVRRARVVEVRPTRRLVVDWWPEDPEVDEPASRVTIEIDPHPDGSVVTVTERALLDLASLDVLVVPRSTFVGRRNPNMRPRALATV